MGKWITPSAPKYDGAPFGNAPKFRIQHRNGKNPKEPGAAVGCDATGEGARFGGPETNGLADWDEPEPKVAPPRIVRPRVVGKLVHRLRRPDDSSVETRLVARTVEKIVISDRHPDADLPSSSLVNLPDGPQFRVVPIFKIETRRIDNAPASRDAFARFDRVSRGKGKAALVLAPENVLKTFRTPVPTGTTTTPPSVKSDAAFVDLPEDRKAMVRAERDAADIAQRAKLIRADIIRQLESATGPRRAALLALIVEG